MGKYRLTLQALANMKGVLEIEAGSSELAKQAALNALGDVAWQYQGLDENTDIQVEVECLEPSEESKQLIRQHWESVRGKVIYASTVLAFDEKNDRDERTFDPPIPFVVQDGRLVVIDHDDWMDSEYAVEPVFNDPRLKGLRTFDVDGRSVALKNQGPVPGLYCQDPKFVVAG